VEVGYVRPRLPHKSTELFLSCAGPDRLYGRPRPARFIKPAVVFHELKYVMSRSAQQLRLCAKDGVFAAGLLVAVVDNEYFYLLHARNGSSPLIFANLQAQMQEISGRTVSL